MNNIIKKIKAFDYKNAFSKLSRKIWGSSFIFSIFSIIFGFLIGFVIMLLVQQNPGDALKGLETLFIGGAKSITSIGTFLFKAAPLILVGLSVGFAFKTGLFNIGASGQFMVGGIAALYVANRIPMAAPWHFIVACLAAILIGALWGFVPGLLKALFNVNEVITTIMMNYIAMYTTYMISNTMKLPSSSYVNPGLKTANIPTLGLQNLFPKSNIDMSIIIAIVVAIIVWVILKKTTLGYGLVAVGHSRDGSKYAGINYKKNIIIAMVIAGGLSGLAAAMNYLPIKPDYFFTEKILNPKGFDGISVALIASSNPLGIIFSGTLLAYIQQGAKSLQFYHFNTEIISIITSSIIYSIAVSSFISMFIVKRREKKRIKKMLEAEKVGENNEL